MRAGTDLVILNHGAWGGDNQTAYWSDVLCRAKQEQPTLGGGKTKLVWRTQYHDTPQAKAMVDLHQNLTRVARRCGWEVLNLREVSGAAIAANMPAYWDEKHFLPFMNDQISDMLLNYFATLWGVSKVVEVCPTP
jgi:hypothetical protein